MFQAWPLFQCSPSLFTEIPGVATDEDTFCELVTTMQNALDAFNDDHPDLSWGDCIQAVLCLAHSLTDDYQEDVAADTADA